MQLELTCNCVVIWRIHHEIRLIHGSIRIEYVCEVVYFPSMQISTCFEISIPSVDCIVIPTRQKQGSLPINIPHRDWIPFPAILQILNREGIR